MSWLRENYRKLAIAGGAVLGVLCPLFAAEQLATCAAIGGVLRAIGGVQ